MGLFIEFKSFKLVFVSIVRIIIVKIICFGGLTFIGLTGSFSFTSLIPYQYSLMMAYRAIVLT